METTEVEVQPNVYEVKSFTSMTPLCRSPEYRLIRIERLDDVLADDVHYLAGGDHAGIVIRRPPKEQVEEIASVDCYPCTFHLSLKHDKNNETKQETRSLKFLFETGVGETDRANVTQQFIKELLFDLPKDYNGFIVRALTLFRREQFQPLKTVDIAFKLVQNGTMQMPLAAEYENDAEIENVTPGHVQEVLEHAFPISLSVDMIADSLRCEVSEVEAFLAELEEKGIVAPVPNQPGHWVRVDSLSQSMLIQSQMGAKKKSPTVAIITCLFVEKQCVEELIEERSTLHNQSKSGEANIYTIGTIAGHQVVASKLAMIGDSREAITSAGSLTTRMLGAFPHVEHVIVVGIAGGVPHLTDPERHIRLGDVVISYPAFVEGRQPIGSYVYAHNFLVDRKTDKIDGFNTRQWGPKDNCLARIVAKEDKEAFAREWRRNAANLIEKLNEGAQGVEQSFSRPPPELDTLTLPSGGGNYITYTHPNKNRTEPAIHLGPVGSMVFVHRAKTPKKPVLIPNMPSAIKHKKHIELIQNDENGVVNNGVNGHGSDLAGDKKQHPINGAGSTASSSDLGLSALNNDLREKFVADYQLKAFDAGFDPVIEAINGSRIDSWVFIRGITDYQQGTTKFGRYWQPYASANAAAMVQTILEHLPREDK